MALLDVRTYFKARLEALGFTQWADPLNVENIPSHILENSYHIESDSGSVVSHNQYDMQLEIPVVVTIFKKGFRDVEQGFENAITAIENIIKECCKAENAKAQTNIKDVELENYSLQAIDTTNDNVIKCNINFKVILILDVNA